MLLSTLYSIPHLIHLATVCVRIVRHREVKSLARCHTARKWQTGFEPRQVVSRASVLFTAWPCSSLLLVVLSQSAIYSRHLVICELKTAWEFGKTSDPHPRNIANPAGNRESAFEHAPNFYLVCFWLRKDKQLLFLCEMWLLKPLAPTSWGW